MNENYGTVTEANDFFAARLHADAWDLASPAEREKALVSATSLIEGLNFKGDKHTVYVLLQSNPHATKDEIYTAESAQALQFPRGADADPPEDINVATYLIAGSLLDGRDPEMELENLNRTSLGISSVRTTYNRDMMPQENVINYIPNAAAWRLLRPYLRDDESVRVLRAS